MGEALSPPWKADRVLTLDGAREAIRAGFPEVDPAELRYLGSGWEFDAYATGDGWVFRFPRRAEYAGAFDRERRVQDIVAPALAPVAVPRIALRGAPTPAFPYPFTGHRLIAGVGADDPAVRPHPSFAADLAAALAAIHTVPVGEALAAGVPRQLDGPAEWCREARTAASGLRGIGPEVDAAVEWLGRVDGAPPRSSGPERLIHNDLGPEHILVDPGTGRLVGILDWTDAALGDPALDFAGPVAWRGWPFAEDLLAAYPAPVDWGFAARVSFLARVVTIAWLSEARAQGAAFDRQLRWLRNAFDGPEPGA